MKHVYHSRQIQLCSCYLLSLSLKHTHCMPLEDTAEEALLTQSVREMFNVCV